MNPTTKTEETTHCVLLVEDEESLATGLEFNLSAEGYDVVHVDDGRKALAAAAARDFDLVILDIMLPFIDGFEVAREIRARSPQLPILMLTARTSIEDRVRGLEIGADDYLTKPFHLTELLARVRGMLRRKRWYREVISEQPVCRFGDNVVDFQTLVCSRGETSFRLTPHEAMVLRYLVDNRDRIVSRTELLERVWNVAGDVETRTVDAFIGRLRKHFEPDPENPVHIKSIRGAGYSFVG